MISWMKMMTDDMKKFEMSGMFRGADGKHFHPWFIHELSKLWPGVFHKFGSAQTIGFPIHMDSLNYANGLSLGYRFNVVHDSATRNRQSPRVFLHQVSTRMCRETTPAFWIGSWAPGLAERWEMCRFVLVDLEVPWFILVLYPIRSVCMLYIW